MFSGQLAKVPNSRLPFDLPTSAETHLYLHAYIQSHINTEGGRIMKWRMRNNSIYKSRSHIYAHGCSYTHMNTCTKCEISMRI